ncbi:xylulose kinase [Kibdelosporangium philippinense]|uniref:Xylulose kinase n=1 Tax=Kibdelosporangium philippinense TaxID=211113 RepID=A0ABS8ZXC0_9PSEU|nr:FGGY-family carbohydrate kinase [Kibdelosporangium philippinense]MCE7011118.1 xylulose kinase [Kibdelosporangium philippinense]
MIVGIDVGTTAVKVSAFTVDGTLVHTHSVGYPISRPRPGWAEQDPLDWWRGTQEGLASLPKDDIQSIGIVSQVNTHVFVDARLQPLAPAIIWQDQRCASIAATFDAQFSAAEKERIWGSPIVLDASFLPARAKWFASTSNWDAVRWVLSPKDYIAARLTGRVATDLLSSVRIAGPSGYIPEAVALVDGLGDRLPPILPSEEVGTMDAFGAVLGTGLPWSERRGMVLCGTSLVVAGASASGAAPGIVTFPPYDGVLVHAGPTQAAGDAVRWWSQVSGLDIADVFSSAASGSSEVVFTPYLAGERAPLCDSTVRASFLGLQSSTTQADMSRAVLEGVAMSGRHVLESVEAACGFTLESLTFSGGGARSPLWTQIFADVLGRPVERLRIHDSGTLGAALQGAVGAGIYPSVAKAAAATVRVDSVFEPSKSMDMLYSVYRDSYEALRNIHARLV